MSEYTGGDDGIIEPASDHINIEKPAPIVPSTGIAGRALTFVVASMCFLACLSFAITVAAQRTANLWSSDVAREATIQVAPRDGTDVKTEVAKALAVAEDFQGIESATVMATTELQSMLSPWLGEDIEMDSLPIPHLISLTIDPANPPDFDALMVALSEAAPNATVDDHNFWSDRLNRGAQTVVIGAALLFILVNAVMIATVVFATRGAMSGNREVIEVLHFVGAPEPFIAREFQRHFLLLGLKAGLIGGVCAFIALYSVTGLLSGWILASDAGTARFLTGQLSISLVTFLGVGAIVFMVAALTALTTRATVLRYLHAIT